MQVLGGHCNVENKKLSASATGSEVPVQVPPQNNTTSDTKIASQKREIPKKDLLELAKTSLQAQDANLKINSFNKILSRLVNDATAQEKWQGSGSLKVSSGTSIEEARANGILAGEMVKDKELQALFGTYPIDDHGVISLSSQRAREFIGQKLSQLRKPSAYKGVQGRKRRAKIKSEPDRETKKVKSMSDGEQKICPNLLQVNDNETDNFSSNIENGACTLDHELSDYEIKRNKTIEENNKVMLEAGLMPINNGVIITLFYLKQSKISEVTMDKLKEVCKKKGVAVHKGVTKKQLCHRLGQKLFKTEVERINSSDTIKYNNLRFMS